MKILKKVRKEKLRLAREARAEKKKIPLTPKGDLIKFSDGSRYYGRNPQFEIYMGYVTKVARGIPFVRARS